MTVEKYSHTKHLETVPDAPDWVRVMSRRMAVGIAGPLAEAAVSCHILRHAERIRHARFEFDRDANAAARWEQKQREAENQIH